jgi:hypothetical protein
MPTQIRIKNKFNAHPFILVLKNILNHIHNHRYGGVAECDTKLYQLQYPPPILMGH